METVPPIKVIPRGAPAAPAPAGPTRVAAYIRWSTDEQSDGTTLEVQTEACRHYILAQGWEWRPDLVFVDDGYSGSTLDRPGLNRLREAVCAQRVNCVVVFKLDRLSRNVLDTVSLLLNEWEGLCEVRSTREPLDTTNPTGKMFFYMLASYAEWERGVIRERTMSGKVKRAQQGRNPGFAPAYGYRPGPTPGEWQIDPGEAALVHRIFAEYLSGKGTQRIAALLQAEGVRPRKARRWHATTILQMLKNVAYMGVLTYGRTGRAPKRTGRARETFSQPRFAQVMGAYPPIIPENEFLQVQELITRRGNTRGRRALSATYLLSGIVRCRCGAGLRGDYHPVKRLRYYRCGNSRTTGTDRCEGALLPARELESAVARVIQAALASTSRLRLMQRFRRDLAQSVAHAKAALRELELAGAALGVRRERLDRDYDTGELSARVYNQRVEQLEQEAADLRAKIEETGNLAARLDGAGHNQHEYEGMAAQVDAWHCLSPEQRKQLLRYFIAEAWAYRSRGHQGEELRLEVDLTIRQILRPDPPAGR